MTIWIDRTLGGFYQRVALRPERMKSQRNVEGRWEYPSLAYEMATSGLEEVETYVLIRQNNISQYIVTRHILELSLEEKR